MHRQLKRLAAVGIVTVGEEGNQKLYQANRKSPIFDELHGLVLKTVGAAEPIRRALEPLASQIVAAFVYGSLARSTDKETSDVDVLVITDELGYPEVYRARSAEATLARAVNPTVMRREEWRDRRRKRDPFVDRVAGQAKLFVIGSEDALGRVTAGPCLGCLNLDFKNPSRRRRSLGRQSGEDTGESWVAAEILLAGVEQ